MPLQNDITKNSYVKVQRLFVSSKDRAADKGTDEYQISLRDNLTNIIGVELTGYSFPIHFAPSFLKPSLGFDGNDTVDFALKAGPIIKIFSFVWPNLKYEYLTLGRPDYISTLSLLFEEAIDGDSTFGSTGTNPTLIEVNESYMNTSIYVTHVGDGISFLWASGPNQKRSAFYQMGFTKVDTPFSKIVDSPNTVQLSPFTYCDVTIQEFPEFKPLKRVYFDKSSTSIVKNDPSVSRTRFLSSQPNRILKTLTISLTLEGNIRAPDDKEHELNFTVFSMQPEIDKIPSWLNQSFVL